MRNLAVLGAASAVLAVAFLMATAGESAAQTAGPPFRPGEVAIYAPPAELAGERVIEYYPNAGISVIRVAQGHERPRVDFYRRLGRRAGLNGVMVAFGAVNDPLRDRQWNFDRVQANEAWESTTGAGVTVAVIDTGVSAGPLDGFGCLLTSQGLNAINGSNDTTDNNGHGTHVAGTIGQASNNGRGVAGLAHGSCILPVKVLGGGKGSGTAAVVAEAIAYVVNAGGTPRASVINMSFGYDSRYEPSSDPLVDPQLDAAAAAGITLVAGAGNEGNRKNVAYPAIHPAVIAVGATDSRNRKVFYSNFGTGLELMAPGGRMGDDVDRNGEPDAVLQETNYGGSWAFTYLQGTSMASPHVAAAAALVRAANPGWNARQVRKALTASALDLGQKGFDSSYGHGVLQAAAAIAHDPNGNGGGTDNDGDGHTVEEGDCDDTDPNVHPGHQDQKGRWGRDGLDNDCNGIIDG